MSIVFHVESCGECLAQQLVIDVIAIVRKPEGSIACAVTHGLYRFIMINARILHDKRGCGLGKKNTLTEVVDGKRVRGILRENIIRKDVPQHC